MNNSLFLIDYKNIEYFTFDSKEYYFTGTYFNFENWQNWHYLRTSGYVVCSSIKIFLIIAMVWRKCGGFIAEESTFLHTNWTSYIELLLEHTTLIFSQGTYNFCFVFKFIIFSIFPKFLMILENNSYIFKRWPPFNYLGCQSLSNPQNPQMIESYCETKLVFPAESSFNSSNFPISCAEQLRKIERKSISSKNWVSSLSEQVAVLAVCCSVSSRNWEELRYCCPANKLGFWILGFLPPYILRGF